MQNLSWGIRLDSVSLTGPVAKKRGEVAGDSSAGLRVNLDHRCGEA